MMKMMERGVINKPLLLILVAAVFLVAFAMDTEAARTVKNVDGEAADQPQNFPGVGSFPGVGGVGGGFSPNPNPGFGGGSLPNPGLGIGTPGGAGGLCALFPTSPGCSSVQPGLAGGSP